MNKSKRILAFLAVGVTALSSFSLTACDNKEGSGDVVVHSVYPTFKVMQNATEFPKGEAEIDVGLAQGESESAQLVLTAKSNVSSYELIACDIQNGDRALVRDVVFENVSLELESAYTPEVIQRSEEQCYDRTGETAIACLLSINNPRFREKYAHLGIEAGDTSEYGMPYYAGVKNVALRNVRVYADDAILAQFGTKCVRIAVQNGIPTTVFEAITVENVSLGGSVLTEADVSVICEGCKPNALQIC